MNIHPRHVIRNQAELELSEKLTEIIKKYNLTYGEIFNILNKLMGNWIKYLMRDGEGEE